MEWSGWESCRQVLGEWDQNSSVCDVLVWIGCHSTFFTVKHSTETGKPSKPHTSLHGDESVSTRLTQDTCSSQLWHTLSANMVASARMNVEKFKTALLSYSLHVKQFIHWKYLQTIHFLRGVVYIQIRRYIHYSAGVGCWVMEDLPNMHEAMGSVPFSCCHWTSLPYPRLSLIYFLSVYRFPLSELLHNGIV